MRKISELLTFIDAAPQDRNTFWHFIEQNYVSTDQGHTEIARYRQVLDIHQKKFGDVPATILRAPGRVELLGAHTDYNGCPVIAAAINRDVIVVVSPRTDQRICFQNVRRRYAVREFDLAAAVPPFETGDWGNYTKAAVQGMLDFLAPEKKAELFSGFNMTVSGKIPAAAGLSSSSALVVVSALSFLHVNGVVIEQLKLAQLLAQAEKYVGTQGGGMDQTISLMGIVGKALKIDFNPYAAAEISLPDDFQIVVAHSLVYAPKTKSAMDKFNRRAIECRLATALIKKHFERELERRFPIKLIGDLTEPKTGLEHRKIEALSLQALAEDRYHYSRIAEILELPVSEVQEKLCLRRDGSVFPEPADGFKLRQRFRHIFQEWDRVKQATASLNNGDLSGFGQIMNMAHVSSRDLYELSTPEVEALIQCGLENGALGARITGAGFGGCTLHLVPANETISFMQKLKTKYYDGIVTEKRPLNLALFLFACKPVNGAGVVIN